MVRTASASSPWRTLLRYDDGRSGRVVVSRRVGQRLEVLDRAEGEPRDVRMRQELPLGGRSFSELICALGHPRSVAASASHATRAWSAASRPAAGPRAKEQTMPTLTDTAVPETPSPLESGRVLGCYQDAEGAQRTILAIDGVEGNTLVVDQSEGAVSDVRLVDHILADEPVLDPSIDNAALVAELYLADPSRGCCRALRLSDLARSRPSSRRWRSPTC